MPEQKQKFFEDVKSRNIVDKKTNNLLSEDLAKNNAFNSDPLPDKIEQRGKNTCELFAISNEIKTNPNNIALKCKYIQKSFSCKASAALRDETDDILKKGGRLVSEVNMALPCDEKLLDVSFLSEQNDYFKNINETPRSKLTRYLL